MVGVLVVEGVLAALILAAIGFCAFLEWRFRALRREQNSLNGSIRAVNGAITAAKATLAALRGSAAQTIETLNTHVNGARALAEELTLLISVGEGIAERIQAGAIAVPVLTPPEMEKPPIAEPVVEQTEKLSNVG